MSGKRVFRNLFSGKPVDTVPLLLPIIPLGAKIMQMPISSVAKDPALVVQCALQIKQLLAPQGMVLYDPLTIIEAFGDKIKEGQVLPDALTAAGSLAQTFEATQRLSATLGRDAAVFAALPGPVELLRMVSDPEEMERCLTNHGNISSLGNVLIDLAKEHMENRADGLVIVESRKYSARVELAQDYRQFFTTVGNIASYYGIPLVVYLQGSEDTGCLPSDLASLDFKGMLFDGSTKPGSLAEAVGSIGDRVIGLTVPEDLLLEMSAGMHNYLKRMAAELPGKRLMLSVPWFMNEDISVSHIVGLNEAVKEAI